MRRLRRAGIPTNVEAISSQYGLHVEAIVDTIPNLMRSFYPVSLDADIMGIPFFGNGGVSLNGVSDDQLRVLSQQTGIAYELLKAQQRAEMASAGWAI